MIKIKYNNYDNVFSGLAPAPLISKSTEYISYGERWAAVEDITLNGNLTGRCLDFTGALFLADQLKQRFNKSFQPFQVIEDTNVIYNSEFASIQGISFPENKFVGVVPFSISLRCYPRQLFSGFFGVLEPQEEISFSERDDGIVEINHTVSARGFNTSNGASNAMGNAKAFVSARTGWQNQITPFFIGYANGINPVLTTIEEVPDRLQGTYSVNSTYISDSYTGAQGVLRYTIQANSGINNPSTISIEGQINGGLNKTIDQIRTRFDAINFYSIASNAYNGTFNAPATGLNPNVLTQQITENLLNNQISFSFQYDDNPTSDVFAEIVYRFEEDSITFNVNSTVEGKVLGRGDRKTRWTRVQNYYNAIKSTLFNGLVNEYNNQNFKYSINPNIVNNSETYDPINATISFSQGYDSSPIPHNKLEYFKYSVSIQPPINVFAEEPLLRKAEYYIQDLNYSRREILSIQGEAKIKNSEGIDEGIKAIRQQINALIQKYSRSKRLTIDDQTFTQGNANMERFISFNVSASYESSDFSV